MAAYRMTTARRAALEKAQAASAAKRRRASKSRRSRLTKRKTLALVAIGGVAAVKVSEYQEERDLVSDPLNEIIINRHVDVARAQNKRMNELRRLGIPPQLARLFDEQAARREAIDILLRRRMKKRT